MNQEEKDMVDEEVAKLRSALFAQGVPADFIERIGGGYRINPKYNEKS